MSIVADLKKFLPRVAIETRGHTLTIELVNRLAEAGLDRFNISIDTLDFEKGRHLQGISWYDVRHAMKIIDT